MESVCRDMDPRDHMDMALGPPLQDPECWGGSRENRRDTWEAVLKVMKTQKGRVMGRWMDRKECERYPDGCFFWFPVCLLRDSPLLHLHELCEKL